MTIVMNMSSYTVEKTPSVNVEYNDEVMCSGWNPQLEQATRFHQVSLMDRHAVLPTSFSIVDVDAFLQKMYSCQS